MLGVLLQACEVFVWSITRESILTDATREMLGKNLEGWPLVPSDRRAG